MNETENPKKDKTMLIVAINVVIMIVYTLIIRIAGGNGYGFIFLAFVLAGHIILCLVMSSIVYSKGFLLSALAVLLIGFSTCYAAYSIR